MELNQDTDPAFAMALDDEDDDILEGIAAVVGMLSSTQAAPIPPSIIVQASKKRVAKQQTGPRKRKDLDHAGALACIKRDYLGTDPLMGSQFKVQFRMSSSMFQSSWKKS